MALADFTIDPVPLGEGSYGVVHLSFYTQWEKAVEEREGVATQVLRLVKREFAMKTLSTDEGDKAESLLMEIALLIYAHRHGLKGVVELYYVFIDVSLIHMHMHSINIPDSSGVKSREQKAYLLMQRGADYSLPILRLPFKAACYYTHAMARILDEFHANNIILIDAISLYAFSIPIPPSPSSTYLFLRLPRTPGMYFLARCHVKLKRSYIGPSSGK